MTKKSNKTMDKSKKKLEKINAEIEKLEMSKVEIEEKIAILSKEKDEINKVLISDYVIKVKGLSLEEFFKYMESNDQGNDAEA